MKVTYEPSTDMGYFYLEGPGPVDHTEPLIIDLPRQGRRFINLDFDANGRLTGIEFMGARGVMPDRLIEQALSGSVDASVQASADIPNAERCRDPSREGIETDMQASGAAAGVMRWFGEWNDAADDGSMWEQSLVEYGAHLDRIAPSLPSEVARLARDPSLDLHDASFRRVEIDLDGRTVLIAVSAGDLAAGYRNIDLLFEDATIVPDNLQRLRFAVTAEFRPSGRSERRTATIIRYEEIDQAGDGRFALRLRLWPFHEFAVEFATVTIHEEPILTRPRSRGGTFLVHGIGR